MTRGQTPFPEDSELAPESGSDPVTRRPRWGRRFAAVGILLLLVSPFWAPPILKRMDFFNVRRIEVRNARYTPADDIRRRLGIDSTFSIWNDLDPLRDSVAKHPQLAGARISRRFPSTIVVTLDELQPVALVPGKNGLQAYDANGKALPLDPSRTPVDVPVVQRSDTAIFRLLGQLQAVQRDVFARVNEVRREGKHELVLDLVTVSVRIRPDISVERLAQVFSVEEQFAPGQRRPRELDFRFRDQVIARFQ